MRTGSWRKVSTALTRSAATGTPNTKTLDMTQHVKTLGENSFYRSAKPTIESRGIHLCLSAVLAVLVIAPRETNIHSHALCTSRTGDETTWRRRGTIEEEMGLLRVLRALPRVWPSITMHQVRTESK